MAWPPPPPPPPAGWGWGPPPVVLPAQRPGRYHRMPSDGYYHPDPQYQTGERLTVPGDGAYDSGLHRSQSVGARPIHQVVINNDQRSSRSPSPARGRPLSSHGFEDWDGRAHSPLRVNRSRVRASTYGSREPSPYYWRFREEELYHENTLQRLKEFEKKQEEDALAKRLEEELILKRAEDDRKAKEKEKLKKDAIEEYKLEELKRKEKEREEKEKSEQVYRERLRKDLATYGLPDMQIARIVDKKESEKAVVSLDRPTYMKIHRTYLSTELLNKYGYPWEWESYDSDYIIIKRWVDESERTFLFEQSRKIREDRKIKEAKEEMEELVKKRKKGSAKRRSLFFVT